MAYDPGLAIRLEELLEDRPGFKAKKMFGGIVWMLNGNMCVGIYKESLMVRVGEKAAAEIFKEEHVEPMVMGGRQMKKWALVAPDGFEEDGDLKRFVGIAEKFVRTLEAKLVV